MKSLYYHEDSYQQIELIPVENELYVQQELADLADCMEKEGFFTEFKKEGRVDEIELSTYKIPFVELDHILSSITVRYDKVTTGYDQCIELCENTVGYTLNNINVFVEYKDGYVTTIWFDFELERPNDAKDLYKILKSVGEKYNLLFVYWLIDLYSFIQTDETLEEQLLNISKGLPFD